MKAFIVGVVVAVVSVASSVFASSVTVSVTGTSVRESTSEALDGKTQYVFSYDPNGPCWSFQKDQASVPQPGACPSGYLSTAVGGVTPNCANGICSCTNWMDCAQRDNVPWGCKGSATPWLPMRARKCDARAGTLTVPSSERSFSVDVATDKPGARAEITGHATVTCAYPPSNGPVSIGFGAQTKYADYGAATHVAFHTSSLVSLCTQAPFSHARISWESAVVQGASRLLGPRVSYDLDARDLMHEVTVRLTNVDDDGLVWLDHPAANEQAICGAHYHNQPGAGSCSLTQIMRSRGVYALQSFAVKFGNGGGWDSSGTVEVLVDGRVAWSGSVSKRVRHTGWFYSATFNVDFVQGSVSGTGHECGLPTDCMN